MVLEALSCGLPVVAYKTKGPKDIIEHEVSGFLAASKNEMAQWVSVFFLEEEKISVLKNAAVERAKNYSKDAIMEQLLTDLSLNE